MEAIMKPTKEQVRDYMQHREQDHTPPPTPEQIRRELGWGMEKGNDEQKSSGWDTPRTV
jgi:hypothetical protein